jgi:hypothetical protein
MPRTLAGLPEGTRLSDYISLGVVARRFPRSTIQRILEQTGRGSRRERELPAHVVVYYVIALALYMQVSYREVLRCLLEGLRWLAEPDASFRPAGASAISQARARLGVAPLRQLYEEVVEPLATAQTPGAWYRGWRVVSLDGTTLDVGDTQANATAFGRPESPRGINRRGAYPQLRLVGLLETGTHVVFGAALGRYTESELTLARALLPRLHADMLCLADRGFLSFDFWKEALQSGAALLWRAKGDIVFPVEERFADGSYRSVLRWNRGCRSADRTPVPVRVIEYTLPGVEDAEPLYRVVTSLLDPAQAPALELATLYHERWEIESAFDELKTHLRGARIVLRSKTPELVLQEAYGFLLAHFAVRDLMHQAALGATPQARDPDAISFVHTVRVIRRTLPRIAALPPSGPGARAPRDPGGGAR